MPPVVTAAVSIAAAIIVVRLVKREWERVNRELDAVPIRVKTHQTLRRDPVTGEWRPH